MTFLVVRFSYWSHSLSNVRPEVRVGLSLSREWVGLRVCILCELTANYHTQLGTICKICGDFSYQEFETGDAYCIVL